MRTGEDELRIEVVEEEEEEEEAVVVVVVVVVAAVTEDVSSSSSSFSFSFSSPFTARSQSTSILDEVLMLLIGCDLLEEMDSSQSFQNAS